MSAILIADFITMMTSPVEEIKSRLDIVEVLGGYLRLQKTGTNYRAVCPFHSEKSPSFFISPSRQIWHCFGCGKGGDIFGFVKEIENIEFVDALKILAQKANVELKPQDPKLQNERQRLLEICELTTKFFEKQLSQSQKGQQAKDYLLTRGLSQKSFEEWRVGYSPNTWNSLTDFLAEKGYKKDEMAKAGIAIKKENSFDVYDRFRGRIMFPIFDLNSQVVGFGGRVFEQTEETAKYINTPQTLIYDKSGILYGLNKAKAEIRKEDKCIVVEGYTDAILSHQAGTKVAVAASGTALTLFQLKLLKRYSDNIFTCFDMDVAGDSATKRGINLAQAQGFNIKVMTLPDGLDPADFILKEGGEAWKDRINKAKSFLEFYFENTFSKFSAQGGSASGGDTITPEQKSQIAKILLPVIKRIPSNVEQSHWVAELSFRLRAPENKVWEDLDKISLSIEEQNIEKDAAVSSELPKKTRKEILEERVLRILFFDPQKVQSAKDYQFKTVLTSQVFESLKDEGDNFSLENFQKKLSPELCSFVDVLVLANDCEKTFKDLDHNSELSICLSELKKIDLRERLVNIGLDIKIKEREDKDTTSLVKEFDELSKELVDLEEK